MYICLCEGELLPAFLIPLKTCKIKGNCKRMVGRSPPPLREGGTRRRTETWRKGEVRESASERSRASSPHLVFGGTFSFISWIFIFINLKQCCGYVSFWCGNWCGSGSVPLINGAGSGRPENIRIRNTGTFTSFFKIKSHKEFTKQYKSRFFLLFLLDDVRIRIRTCD